MFSVVVVVVVFSFINQLLVIVLKAVSASAFKDGHDAEILIK